MGEHERLWRELGIPPGVLALALQTDPGGVFTNHCLLVNTPFGFNPPRRAIDIVPPDMIPLWAAPWTSHNAVVGCRRLPDGLKYVALDILHVGLHDTWHQARLQARQMARMKLGDDPNSLYTPYRIACSDQGLLFWVFSDVLQDTAWPNSEDSKQVLQKAADAVGFRYLDEVWDLVWAADNNPAFHPVHSDDPSYTPIPFYEGCEFELLTRTRNLDAI